MPTPDTLARGFVLEPDQGSPEPLSEEDIARRFAGKVRHLLHNYAAENPTGQQHLRQVTLSRLAILSNEAVLAALGEGASSHALPHGEVVSSLRLDAYIKRWANYFQESVLPPLFESLRNEGTEVRLPDRVKEEVLTAMDTIDGMKVKEQPRAA